MVVGIHQPEHLPWLGFFHKMYLSDVFVLLDNVQYRKDYFQNRNRLRGSNGFCWITIPVLSKGKSTQLLKEVEINLTNRNWQKKVWVSIAQNYNKAPFFSDYGTSLKEIYCGRQWQKLVDLNVTLINKLAIWLDIKTELVLASNLGVEGKSTDLLLKICQKLNASIYLSGKFGRTYLDESKFTRENIRLVYHNFIHPSYNQVYKPFLPEISAIDLLMNHGKESLGILTAGQGKH